MPAAAFSGQVLGHGPAVDAPQGRTDDQVGEADREGRSGGRRKLLAGRTGQYSSASSSAALSGATVRMLAPAAQAQVRSGAAMANASSDGAMTRDRSHECRAGRRDHPRESAAALVRPAAATGAARPRRGRGQECRWYAGR